MFNSLGYEIYLDDPTGYYMLREKTTETPFIEEPKEDPEVTPKTDPNVTVSLTPEKIESPKQYRGFDATAIEALPTLFRAL
jgi:hypothetical protein